MTKDARGTVSMESFDESKPIIKWIAFPASFPPSGYEAVRGISLICSFVPFHCPARGRRRNDVSIVTATNVSGAT